MNKEAKEEESKGGKREVEGERVETRRERISPSRLPSKFSRSSVTFLWWRVLGMLWIVRCRFLCLRLCLW